MMVPHWLDSRRLEEVKITPHFGGPTFNYVPAHKTHWSCGIGVVSENFSNIVFFYDDEQILSSVASEDHGVLQKDNIAVRHLSCFQYFQLTAVTVGFATDTLTVNGAHTITISGAEIQLKCWQIFPFFFFC